MTKTASEPFDEAGLAELRQLKAAGDLDAIIRVADAKLEFLIGSSAHFQDYDLWFLARHSAFVDSGDAYHQARAIDEGLAYPGRRLFHFSDRLTFLTGLKKASMSLGRDDESRAFDASIRDLQDLLADDIFPGPSFAMAVELCALGDRADEQFKLGNFDGALILYEQIFQRLESEQRYDAYLLTRAAVRMGHGLLLSGRFEDALDFVNAVLTQHFSRMKKIGHWLLIDGAMVLEDSTLYNLLSVAVIPTFIHLEKQVRLNGINELATIVCRSLPARYRALQVCALATWQRSLRWLQAF